MDLAQIAEAQMVSCDQAEFRHCYILEGKGC